MMDSDLYLVYNKQERRLFRVCGSTREEIGGLRLQALALIGCLDEHNRANGYALKECKYNDLIKAVWGPRGVQDERFYLTRLVLEIRRKIEPDPNTPRLLMNIRGVGYLLVTRPHFESGHPAPFICGPPVTEPRRFFGRQRELKQIYDLWKSRPIQNVVVIGPRRSGKTSLLHYLKNIHTAPPSALRPGQSRNGLSYSDEYRFVLLDFQDTRICRRERFFRRILHQLDLQIPPRCNLEQFMDTMSQGLTRPTLLLFDEICSALASPEFDTTFWGSLRSLGSNHSNGLLGFVLASHQSPAKLAVAHEKPSPFFNIFGHTLRLGPLTDKEAHELISSSPSPFPPEDVEWILRRSHLWPCLLQILCYNRLTALNEGEADDAWKERSSRAMLPFRYLLQKT